MTPGEFIAAFDVIAEAPGGIERLRELVLQLAVRGKLVPQDGGEEPAAVLLDRIREERAQLIHAKQIRPQKQREPITCSQLKVPEGWKHLYLGDVIDLEYGKSLPHKDRKESGDVPVYGSNGVVGQHDVALVNGPCIVVGRKGSAGAVTLAGTSCWPIDTTYFVRPYGGMSLKYTSLMLLTARLEELDRATAIPGLNREEAYLRETLLPPLAEQHRIVAKVDELMGLIDRLEAARSSREDVRTAGRDSALAALRNAATPEEVGTAWTRIAERMDDLFTAPADLAPLREAVLQLAVRGRLVPQELTDEPASVLLDRIVEEKTQRDKRIKTRKTLPTIQDGMLPFEIPISWEWTQLGEITSYGTTEKAEPDEVSEETWVLELEDIEKVSSRLLNRVRYGVRPFKSTKNRFYKGDVLYGKLRPYLDKVVLADEDGVCSSEIMPIRSFVGLAPQFMRLVLKAPYFVQYANSSTHGMNLPRLGTDKARQALFPLPPEAEQHRIVAKVDELMGLIDRLEQYLVAKEGTQGELAVAWAGRVETRMQ